MARHRVPMLRLSSFSFSSRAASSVPPVVAPARSMMPQETPMMTPPYRQARMGSIGLKVCTAARPSIIRELTAVA